MHCHRRVHHDRFLYEQEDEDDAVRVLDHISIAVRHQKEFDRHSEWLRTEFASMDRGRLLYRDDIRAAVDDTADEEHQPNSSMKHQEFHRDSSCHCRSTTKLAFDPFPFFKNL
jgi:hypothetical protein